MKKVLQLKPGIIFILMLPLAFVAPGDLEWEINMIGYVFYLFWIGIIGYYVPKPVLQNKVNTDVALFFSSLILFPILLTLIFAMKTGKFGITEAPSSRWIRSLNWIAYALIFYPVIYVSKAIAQMELKKEVKVGDYISNIFLLIPGLSLIGVWFIQPRLKKLFSNSI